MPCVSEFALQLRERGYRMTPQRMAILHVLRHEGTHLSPADVYQKARRDFPRLTEPTVYRTLEFLTKNGIVRSSLVNRGHLTYELAGEDHHHVICRVCGIKTGVEHNLLEEVFKRLESTSGYSRIDSHVTFFGICPQCQKKPNQETHEL